MKKLKIDILCNDGSPLGVSESDIYGQGFRIGVGGAELALLTLCAEWTKAGHTVTLFNNPNGGTSSFKQEEIHKFKPQDNRDILIIFRSPNYLAADAKGRKIWWSCDQYTIGNFSDFAHRVDKIITISPFHAEFFQNTYQIKNSITIDLPVRVDEYNLDIPKIDNRLIFCSVPDRGLGYLAQIFPKIKKEIPDASLVITSDYRLWGVPEPRNEQFIRQFMGMDGVRFIGAVSRQELVKEQLSAQIQTYPCIYDELFCYAVAECQVAGTLPITTKHAALETTNGGYFSSIDNFADDTISFLTNPRLKQFQEEIKFMATQRFSPSQILKHWDKVFYE